jgi:hypothetical protein
MGSTKKTETEEYIPFNPDTFREDYKAYLKTRPLRERIARKLWPVPYKFALIRRMKYWADKHWHLISFKHAWHRATRGYGRPDTWSLDYYLCWWMPRALADLRDNMVGCGALYNEKGKEIKWTDVDKGCEIRVQLLNQMIEGFKAYQRILDWETSYSSPEYKETLETGKKGLLLFAHNFLGMWD